MNGILPFYIVVGLAETKHKEVITKKKELLDHIELRKVPFI